MPPTSELGFEGMYLALLALAVGFGLGLGIGASLWKDRGLEKELAEIKDYANGLIQLVWDFLPICPAKRQKMILAALERGRKLAKSRQDELESAQKELAEARKEIEEAENYIKELIQFVVPCYYNYPECPAKRQEMMFAAIIAVGLAKMEDKG